MVLCFVFVVVPQCCHTHSTVSHFDCPCLWLRYCCPWTASETFCSISTPVHQVSVRHRMWADQKVQLLELDSISHFAIF